MNLWHPHTSGQQSPSLLTAPGFCVLRLFALALVCEAGKASPSLAVAGERGSSETGGTGPGCALDPPPLAIGV